MAINYVRKLNRPKPQYTVKCLGWCDGTFLSTDKVYDRFCRKCLHRKLGVTLSRAEVIAKSPSEESLCGRTSDSRSRTD